MSLWGTMAASKQAMLAQSHALGLIGQNVSNMNTTGYKEVDGQFKTMLNETTGGGRFDFFTARNSDRQFISRQGQMTDTGNDLDLGINGQGFFITRDSPGAGADGAAGDADLPVFSRDGAFRMSRGEDGHNYLTTQDGRYLMGSRVTGDGQGAVAPNNIDALEPVDLTAVDAMEAQATTQVSVRDNIPPSTETDVDGGVAIYTPGGETRELGLTWSKSEEQPNTWTVTSGVRGATVDADGTGSNEFTVRFGRDGELFGINGTEQKTLAMDIAYDDGTASSPTLDLSGSTQLGDEHQRYQVDRDGHAAGRLDRTFFSENGSLRASYTNGEVQDIYEIPLADFTARDQLEQLSGTAWRQTQESGELSLFSITGAQSGRSTFVPQALERSNVQVEEQFTRMMLTQRAYSSASKTFTTADEMSQTARDMKR